MSVPHSPSQRRSHKMRFGAEVHDKGTRFKIWAPNCSSLRLRLKGKRDLLTLEKCDDGWYRLDVEGVKPGALYKYVLPDDREIPDPASRFQPDDLEGFCEVIDPNAFEWTDGDWRGRPWEEAIIYELHIGSFTEGGSFSAAIDKLDHLVRLGVTAIQILPLADFYGRFNWGYDGAMWFAPDCSYGRPDDLKTLVNAAHGLGLMVFLDVVYNHFGPYGNYLPDLAPIFSQKRKGDWGEAINFDGPGAPVVREFTVESALYWMTEFNLDGLRFDAVHSMDDYSPTHILELLSARIRAARPLCYTHLIVENSDNAERWLRRDSQSEPVHFTAQWNDDLHHILQAAATGEHSGYYADYGSIKSRGALLGRALAEGFAYQGELKPHEGMTTGEPSGGLPSTSFVVYMQNHDQVGNRVRGDRIISLASPAALDALTAIYLLCPQIPMLFMGEEWASKSPFPFFSDVPAKDRASLQKGREEELKKAPEHDAPEKPNAEEAVDPTSPETFASSKLDWHNIGTAKSTRSLERYRSLLDLRAKEIVPRLKGQVGFAGSFEVLGPGAVAVTWRMGDGAILRLVANLHNEPLDKVPHPIGRVLYAEGFTSPTRLEPWAVIWTISV
jgi:maltooligosyltrehalose trehalohydrolase